MRVLSRSESDHETESKDVENESDADERLEVSSVSKFDHRKSAESPNRRVDSRREIERATDRTRIPVAAQVRILEKMLRPRIRVADSTDWLAAMDTARDASVQYWGNAEAV